MAVHTSVGGERLRVRLTNLYGEQAVKVGHATIARPDTTTPADLSDIDPATVRELTFNGATSTTMNKGAELLERPGGPPGRRAGGPDRHPVLPGAHRADHLPRPVPGHQLHRRDRPDHRGGRHRLHHQAELLLDVPLRHRRGAPRSAPGAVVVYGDSIADGNGSTVNANKRWPDLLADRLVDARPEVRDPRRAQPEPGRQPAQPRGPEPGAGGFPGYYELGPNALARLNEDVFPQTGVRTLITHLGINDIWMNGDSAESIIASLRQINEQVEGARADQPGRRRSPRTRATAAPGCGRRRRTPPGRR